MDVCVKYYWFWTFLCLCVQSTVCNTIEKVIEGNPDKLNNIIDEMKQILTPMAQK